MDLFPAIDLRGGRVVRLAQGEAGRQTVYGDDAATQAASFIDAGARWIHVVDLDRAFGDGNNDAVLAHVVAVAAGRARVQVGGGVRSVERAEALLAAGVSRVVVGTAAVERPELIDALVAAVGASHVAIGLDARDGLVAVRGWVETSPVRAPDLARRVASQGIDTIIFTDIARDGMLTGPDLDGARAVASALGATGEPHVIVSGGIATLDDIRQVARAGLAGVIVGRALYEGHFTLTDALALGAK